MRLSFITLVLSNLIPLVGVWFFGWDRWSIVFLYWTESAVIGFYAILKMLLAKGPPKKLTRGLGAKKPFIIIFFMIHFGGFMMVHLALLTGAHVLFATITGLKQSTSDLWNPMLIGGFSMMLSHGYSFITNFRRGREYERVTAGEVMISPYPRIILMQLVSFFCFILFAPEIVMVLFKTVFDAIGHMLERRMFQRPVQAATTRDMLPRNACPFCNAEVAPSNQFCTSCGRRLLHLNEHAH